MLCWRYTYILLFCHWFFELVYISGFWISDSCSPAVQLVFTRRSHHWLPVTGEQGQGKIKLKSSASWSVVSITSYNRLKHFLLEAKWPAGMLRLQNSHMPPWPSLLPVCPILAGQPVWELALTGLFTHGGELIPFRHHGAASTSSVAPVCVCTTAWLHAEWGQQQWEEAMALHWCKVDN